MAGRGRPVTYDASTATEIARRIASGESLRAICREEGMPPESTVREWAVDDRDGFAARYARACEARVERWAEEIVEIADDGTGDTWTDEEGTEHANSDVIQRSRLRVDTRKWLMSKMIPKRYGDKVTLGGDAADPLIIEVRHG